MLRKSPLRVTFTFFLGFFGGLSLTSSIFPFVVSEAYGISSVEILMGVNHFTVPVALLWAVGGGLLGWIGRTWAGGLVLGACGLISGFGLSTLALGAPPALIVLGSLTGLIYGGTAGLLLGTAFARPAEHP